jgi:hypothetical protein
MTEPLEWGTIPTLLHCRVTRLAVLLYRVNISSITNTCTAAARCLLPGVNTFFGRAAALICSTNNVANIQKVSLHSKHGACIQPVTPHRGKGLLPLTFRNHWLHVKHRDRIQAHIPCASHSCHAAIPARCRLCRQSYIHSISAAAALLLLQVMTKIGAVCLITIGIWIIVELAVQFGGYGHDCHIGEGAQGSALGEKQLRSTQLSKNFALLASCMFDAGQPGMVRRAELLTSRCAPRRPATDLRQTKSDTSMCV